MFDYISQGKKKIILILAPPLTSSTNFPELKSWLRPLQPLVRHWINSTHSSYSCAFFVSFCFVFLLHASKEFWRPHHRHSLWQPILQDSRRHGHSALPAHLHTHSPGPRSFQAHFWGLWKTLPSQTPSDSLPCHRPSDSLSRAVETLPL